MLLAYDFTQFGHIVDVGGGNGTLIASLLAACRQASGTLLDLAHVVAGAGEILEQAACTSAAKSSPVAFSTACLQGATSTC